MHFLTNIFATLIFLLKLSKRVVMKFNSTENLKARLRQHGLRPTRQRVRLAGLLLDGQNRHVRPDDIYEQLKSGPAKLSRGTVYNTLRQFCNAGLLSEVNGVGDSLVYDTNLHEHHHFLNVETGELSDIQHDKVQIRHMPELPEGYAMDAVELTIRIRKSSQ